MAGMRRFVGGVGTLMGSGGGSVLGGEVLKR
jgi:hypothetical protein